MKPQVIKETHGSYSEAADSARRQGVDRILSFSRIGGVFKIAFTTAPVCHGEKRGPVC